MSEVTPDPSAAKRPFDKRKYRENKYSKKVKVERWQDHREKALKARYFKMIKKGDNANLDPLGPERTPASTEAGPARGSQAAWRSVKRVQREFEGRQKKAAKRQRDDEKKQKHLARVAALQAYRDQKTAKFKLLSRKNRKGQPIMAGRMELLLEKIQAQADH